MSLRRLAIALLATVPLPAVDSIKPLLDTYCARCHTGKEAAAGFELSSSPVQQRKLWARALERVKAQEMPPAKPLPSPEEREQMVKAIDAAVNHVDPKLLRYPGHVTIPRLNRAEYNNTIRDLTGIDLRPADAFPEDTFGQSGFNNDREAQFIPPLLIEKYLQAADAVVDEIHAARSDAPRLERKLEVENLLQTEQNQPAKPYGRDLQAVQNTLYEYVRFPRTTNYTFRIKGWSVTQYPGTIPGVALRVANELKFQSPVKGTRKDPQVFEVTVPVRRGNHRVSLHYYRAVLEEKPLPEGKTAATLRVVLSLDWLDIAEAAPARPPVDVLSGEPRKAVERFAARAWRRSVSKQEVDSLLADGSLDTALKAVLVSPNFLFRPEAVRTGKPRRLNDNELASRLSYFLWQSMPDDELFAQAARKRLRDPAELARQVRRMAADPKAVAWTDEFFSQWLGYNELGKSANPDRTTFPTFQDLLRRYSLEESSRFFADLFQRDESLLRLLDADYGFLNEDLARHYGVAGVEGREFRRVALDPAQRGGILGMASVLAATSTPVRTSPVIRGKWIAETLLGEEIPPPPAAADLPEPTPETKGMTLRQRLELHRSAAQCAGCHKRMDPLGFGLENFDAIGRWRELDNGHPVDAAGALSTGESFRGPAELRKLLLDRKDRFVTHLARRALGFALGRELRYYDEPEVEKIARRVIARDYRPGELVLAIVESYPFQYQGPEVEQARKQ